MCEKAVLVALAVVVNLILNVLKQFESMTCKKQEKGMAFSDS